MFLTDIFPRIFARHLLRPGGVVLPRVADAVDAEAEGHRAEEGVAQETPDLQLEPGPGRGGMGIIGVPELMILETGELYKTSSTSKRCRKTHHKRTVLGIPAQC